MFGNCTVANCTCLRYRRRLKVPVFKTGQGIKFNAVEICVCEHYVNYHVELLETTASSSSSSKIRTEICKIQSFPVVIM